MGGLKAIVTAGIEVIDGFITIRRELPKLPPPLNYINLRVSC